MAEMVGSALLSGLFSVLFERLATEEVKNFLLPKKVINELLKKLKVLLLSARKLLADAEEKQIKDDEVKTWHNDLKDVVFKADELADKIETEVLRLKMEENQSASESSAYEYWKDKLTTLPSNLLKSFDNYVKDELEEILSSLEDLLSQKDALGLEPAGKSNYSGDKTRVSERFRPTPVADESVFCGREDMKLSIIKSLLRSEDDVSGDKVSVIPVIGAGGLGKTTLVQMIYDHVEVKQLFKEVRAWITVSTEFHLPTITKTIIEKIARRSPIKGNEDPQDLLFKLKNVLKGKKFLLVLDDVWSEDRGKWNTLKSCFKSAESGSKIIVTTRSAKVASIMAPVQNHHFLQELPEKDCLKLFAQTVFSDDRGLDAYSDWKEIGEKIVRKCKGNPLSLITVGGILRDERRMEEWKKILENSLWELLQEENEDIIPSLWLSYLYLPSEIKPCFAYCSIFPKDYRFKNEEVVQLWMAEGFLQNEAGKRGITMEEVGERYFEELISRSLFQRSKYEGIFIMHDLVHDLAMNVSGEFCLCLDGGKNLGALSCKTRYLSCKMENLDVKKFEGSKAKRLHSFFVGLQGSTKIGGDVLKVLEELAMEGGCLRVLSLSSARAMKSLPDSIGNLKHLRYLKLSWVGVQKLPDSVGTLYSLQALLLSNCHELTQLPDSIGDLKHLRYLKLFSTGVKKLPDSIGTLYGLQKLFLSYCSKLTQLPDSIGDLKHLRYLNLSWTRVKKLPDSVGTLYNLQTLLLSGCGSLTRLPSNLGSLTNLHHLDTDSILEEMPPHMCNLTKLQTLSDFVVGKRGSSIRDLGALHDLNGELRISGLQNVDDVLKGNLKDKKNLSELVLEWESQTDASRDSRKEERVLDALQPHANLKELFIYHYGGTSFPNWVGDSLFSKIDRMHLNGCQDCLSLPSLGRLPSLKELRIEGFHRLETIGDGFYGNDCPFKSLEVLHFEDMPEWKRWSVIEVPRLRELKLKGCPKLVGGLPNCNTITTLDIYGCESLDFPEDHLYPSLESLKIEQSYSSIRRLSLEHLPKLNELELKGLECLVELTGESSNEVKRLFIEKCPKLEFMGNGRYGSLKALKIEKCEALKSIPLDYFPKLNELDLKELECPVELTGESLNELKSLSIKECPKLEFMGNVRYGSLKALKIEKCEALKSIPLNYFPKLNKLDLKELECPVELAGESLNELKSLSIKECPKLEFMGNVRYGSLKALKIEKCEALKSIPLNYFPKLNELDLKELECPVELAGESLNELKSLSIEECPKLEFMGGYGSLKALKIEKCEALKSIPLNYFPKLNKLDLKELECLVELMGDSPDELERLSIEKCPKLEYQWNGRYGSLKNLEIKKDEALKSIPLCYFPKLNKLTLRHCQNFESFRFAEEPPLVLESLSLEGLPKFVSFPEGGLPAPNLKRFYINECENLRSLPQQMHRLLPSLKSFSVSNCGEIESPSEGGLPSNLVSLDIRGCKKLAAQVMHWDLQVTRLKSFSIDGRGEELLDSFPPEGLLPSSLTSLDIRNFRRLKTLNIHAFQHLEDLYVQNCDELQCLPEESLPNSLSYLDIEGCPLLERRYRKETGEGWHKISHIQDVLINGKEQQ